MIILKHRVNSIKDFDVRYGVEIDVRDFNNKLVISHDLPNENSLELESFLVTIPKETFLAINVKSSEIEFDLKRIIDKHKFKNYFTFDHSIPSLIKSIKCNLSCAFRLSEYEKEIIPNCTWVWVDCFEKIWYDSNFLGSLKDLQLKIALVSPELHGRKSEIEKFEAIVNSISVDAICTDMPEYWNND
jgi:hypothetical protein